jgi:hypothetical protein
VNVVNQLVRNPAVVLQDVEVLHSNGVGDLLCHGKELCQGVVGDVCELLAVELGNDKLILHLVNIIALLHDLVWIYTDSMALAQRLDVHEGKDLLALEELHGGNLPYELVREAQLHQWLVVSRPTLDDLAEDARCCHVGGMMCCD